MSQAPRTHSPETWAAARDDYLSGYTAHEVCRRHGLGLSAFRDRARDQGWRRTDQPSPMPQEEPLDTDAPLEPRAQLIDKAWRRLSLALDAGRSSEATRWARVHAMLVAAAEAEDHAEDRRATENLRATTRIAQGIEAQAAATLRRLQLEDMARSTRHPNDPDSKKVPTPPLNRAERRRQAKGAAGTRFDPP